MFPGLDDLAATVDDLDPVGQNFTFWKKESCIAPGTLYGTADHLFRIVPKAHRCDQLQLLSDQVPGKFPADEEALPFRGALLSWIGRADVEAGQKAPIDPLLLDVEVVLIAACKKGEEKNRK